MGERQPFLKGLGKLGWKKLPFQCVQTWEPDREVIQGIWGAEVPGGEVSKFGHVSGSEVTLGTWGAGSLKLWSCEGNGDQITNNLVSAPRGEVGKQPGGVCVLGTVVLM